MSLYELEMAGDPDEVLDLLRGTGKPVIQRRAAEILGEMDLGPPETREEVVTELVGLAQSDEESVSAAAIDALGRIGTEAVAEFVAAEAAVDLSGEGADWVRAEAFAGALEDERPELRMAAASALGSLGATDAVPALADCLDDPDPRVRSRVARALGRLGDPRAVDPLVERLDDEHHEVRREVAEALGSTGTAAAREALESLARDDDPFVRRVAVSVLGEFESAGPIPELGRALGDDHEAVRRAAVYSLIDLLVNVPTERSHAVRDEVVDELSSVEDERIVGVLTDILVESTEVPRRRNAAWLLGRVTGEVEESVARAAIDALVGSLGDEDNATRQFAATSLVSYDDETVEGELLDALEDPEAGERQRAQTIFVLGKVGGERARERLDALLEETESETVREQAFSALSKLGGR